MGVLPPLPLSIEQETLMVLKRVEDLLRIIADNTKPRDTGKHKR